mgnify:CR=1 FL=1
MTSPPEPASSSPDDGEGPFRPLIFGEALFDHFPDGSRVLGGAPFNVAWHLRGLGGDPLLVTAVGRDEEGREILARMEEWGMDTSGVQVHPRRPTGRVEARTRDGEVTYEIEGGQAYDAVTQSGLPPSEVLRDVDLLYHGTLALREETSRKTLEHLRETLLRPVLLDVNLRDPWWSPEEVHSMLARAEWVKMNREEASLLGTVDVEKRDDLLEAGRSLQNHWEIRHLVVTLGSRGALGLDAREAVWEEAPEVTEMVDTVGAGDAFSTVLALGIHGGWGLSTILRRATEFAADLCRIQGAVPDDPALYETHLERWSHVS